MAGPGFLEGGGAGAAGAASGRRPVGEWGAPGGVSGGGEPLHRKKNCEILLLKLRILVYSE